VRESGRGATGVAGAKGKPQGAAGGGSKDGRGEYQSHETREVEVEESRVGGRRGEEEKKRSTEEGAVRGLRRRVSLPGARGRDERRELWIDGWHNSAQNKILPETGDTKRDGTRHTQT
jgi:hypothetical protein